MQYAKYYFEKELSKERMLRTVLKAQGDYLTKKSSQRLAWWSRRRWSSVITPKPSEKQPLWFCEESLPVYLLNLTPEQLKTKIHAYWEKPAWKQWLLRLWTPISQQVAAWSYYQKCLAFREVQQKLLKVEPGLQIATHEQILFENLGHWLIKEELRFQRSVENRSYQWLSKYFDIQLHQHEKKRAEKFLKQLEKELAKLPEACDSIRVRERAQLNYQEVGEVMYGFNWAWYYKYLQQIKRPTIPRTEERLMVATCSNSASAIVNSPLPKTVAQIEKVGFGSSDSRAWFDTRRQAVNELLAQKESIQRDNAIKTLLGESLTTLFSFIEPQLAYHGEIVRKVCFRVVEPEIAMEAITSIQPSLMKHYRHGVLLFHPDRFHELNKTLHTCWNENFIRYKQFFDSMMNRLYINQNELGKILVERRARKREHEMLMKQLDDLNLAHEIFMREMDVRFKAMEEKADRRDAQLEELERMIKQLNRQSNPLLSDTSQPIETTESEENAASFSFKA